MTNQIQNPNDSKRTLAIDTASDEAGVWLLKDEEVIGEKKWENGPGVGTRLLIETDELLKSNEVEIADIEEVIVKVVAQKWFSSVRAGVATANGLTIDNDVKLYELEGIEDGEIKGKTGPAAVAKVRYLR